MLEFQEDFFEQEVREGFYLDTTIKTLWASEMELLNKIAEVCTKYNLQWYAAYGTLLGAIRHEGYVPWDDDMDIWMMRKDYNKLMEVLQKELPTGYRVRGPQTEEGYDQFHSCINNGSGISIAKDWLEKNHNCPFTVGIDIFPLDYLPKNKKDREMQKSLFTLVGRVAQISKNINRGDYDEEDAVMTKREAIEQVEEGLRYLKKNYKFSLDMKWLEEEKWDKITSEVWKWGNYVASMYGEKESDYIVEYLDYARFETKKFPKEWFAETYAAKFENVMLPIPCNYEEILETIYSRYNVIIRNDACHEYPFYSRQLRQLRQYVKNAERGIIGGNIDDVIEDKERMPREFMEFVEQAKKQGKKIVLTANDVSAYWINPQEALERLAERLEFFKMNNEKLALWWRPYQMMKKNLNMISAEFGDKYQKILDDYRTEGWGICDEGACTDWAIENCEIYYGEKNAILQPFQNIGKPIMLSEQSDEANSTNNMMIRLTRTFLNFTDYVTVGKKIYFSNTNYNALIEWDREKKIITDTISFEDCSIVEKDMHLHCVEKDGKICFLPVGNGKIRIFDTTNKHQIVKELKIAGETSKATWNSFKTENEIYLLPGKMEYGLWKWDYINDNFIKQEWWTPGEAEENLIHGVIDTSRFFTLIKKSNILLITDVTNKNVTALKLPDDDVCTIQGDGEDFWYTKWDDPFIVHWNTKTGKKTRKMLWEEKYVGKHVTPYYYGSYKVGNKLFVTSRLAEDIFVLDTKTEQINVISNTRFTEWEFVPNEKEPFFKVDGEKLIISMRNTNLFRVVNLNDLSVQDYLDAFKDCENTEYRNKVLLNRGVLLYEENNRFSISNLIEL